ncbi:pyruvate dehydrogenase complex dihydrolipoamide acetyltransferase [Flavobacterium sp.]|uniref:pyruvate dehydrogenase complex dihydrolipoamide acetyltransferase n=1 Tax=Flavobacterium sp. TaxID=239 RepID=UPI002B4B27F4|nr:pyruvate dehydrogenase complex dihydrolipoamide acetyltransferase [Flavobacterium sp.]HLP64554.1 pyruvate dehydrogenase complex dihydrolipoamide acetyltransferase [Flavobacterium sp.]
MATIITMPRLSDTMTEGTVATWLKKVGDTIKEGDILAEIETDKATMEFESFNSGTLLHIGIEAGKTAPVDSLLAIIGKEGEDISALLSGTSASSTPKAEEKPTEVEAPKENKAASVEIPSGVKVITMPRLSDTMTTGTVATWLKKVGDAVKEGDMLAEIETDKATMEFESFNAGTLLYIGIQEGESAPVDSVLAIIGPAGTDITGIAENYSKGGETKSEVKTEATSPSTPAQTTQETSNSDNSRIFASPLARQIAKDKGINLSQVKGSGENGRIVKSDVENFTASTSAAPTQTTTSQPEVATTTTVKPFVPAGETYSEKIPNSTMRKVIAKRLSESIFTAPHFYLTIEVAMDEAMKSRATINTIPDTKVSFNDMVIKACAMALKKHPKVNSQWADDAITIHHHVNIGVAVAVEDGLVVPVLKFADQMSLSQIGNNVKDVAGRAKNKKLQPAEMEGSTFTVSNLGMFGITEFTSIINQPNSAILSVGAIVEKPVVRDGQIVVGNTMKVTLACDHRTVDGATGAQFLQTLRTYLENPVTMLA